MGLSTRAWKNTLNVLTSSDFRILYKMESLSINFYCQDIIERHILGYVIEFNETQLIKKNCRVFEKVGLSWTPT